MKKIIYFMLFASVFMLFSCGNEKENEKEKPAKKCDPGFEYRKDWDSCVDIDECKTDNGGCSDICKNTVGSFECSCNDGFTLDIDSKTCMDINECLKNNGDCEQICTNNRGSFTCSCDEGFELQDDNKTCKDLNDCKENSCNKHGVCIDGDDSFTCECEAAYKGDTCDECAEGYELYETDCVKRSHIEWRNGGSYESLLGTEAATLDDNDNIYVTGNTYQDPIDDEHTKFGGYDVFVSKVGSDMEIKWHQQCGTAEDDTNSNVTVDNNGNIYVAFKTTGIFTGTQKGTGSDVALVKLDNNGNILWKKQFVTETENVPTDMVSDSNNNVFIIGHRKMNKVFIKKLDENGNELDEKVINVSGADYYNKIDIDEDDNLYITARTSYSVGGSTHIGNYDILIVKLDNDLNDDWYKEVGTEARESARNIFYKNGYVYISGNTNVPQSNGWGDGNPYLIKMDKNGHLIFDKVYNGLIYDTMGIAVNSKGDIFLGGIDTENTSKFQKFLKKIDSEGNLIWETSGTDHTSRESMTISLETDSNDSLIETGILHGGGYRVSVEKFTF